MKLEDLTPHIINIAEKSKETFNNLIDKLIVICKEKQKEAETAEKPTTPSTPATPEEKPKDDDNNQKPPM